jgi:hypothetical protein
MIRSKQNPVRTHGQDGVNQCVSAEVPAGCDIEIVPQTVGGHSLRGHSSWKQSKTMFGAPDCAWQHLAKMTQDDGEFRIRVEQSTRN